VIDAIARRAMILLMLRALLLVTALALALGAAGARGEPLSSAGPPESWCGVNAVVDPSAENAAEEDPFAASPPFCFGCSEAVSYRAFDGRIYALTRYAGRFTELLLPTSWIDGAGLDDAARRLLLERADFIYQHAKELMGGEPAGAGRLQIAVVDVTCGFGCGNVGARGVEIESTSIALSEIRGDLAAGVLPRILVHELGHNFDLLNRDLWLGATSTFDYHAWTAFFEPYLAIYTRMGSTTVSPDELQRMWTESTYGAYIRNPDSSFERCIAQTACGVEPGAADRAWGGVTLRFVELHGPHGARRFLAALETLRASRGPPQTLQDRADLHFEAMAMGAGSDLACYADAWRWSISPALRSRLAGLPPEPRCADVDGDLASPLLGDCDDTDPDIGPGMTEVANGEDDDCSGAADDLLLVEPAGGDFAGASLGFPGRVAGAITLGDVDDFFIDVPATGNVAFDLCSQGFQGWLFVYRGISWLGYQYSAKGQCSHGSYALTQGRWRVAVELNSASEPGAYTLAAAPGSPWPAPRAAAETPRADACRLVAKAESEPIALGAAADRTRFWITGTGFVAEASHVDVLRAAFYPEGGAAASLRLRTQRFDAEVPVTDWSGARDVAYAPPPGVDCEADSDGDGVITGLDLCPTTTDPAQGDADGDGVGDACDSCTLAANGPLLPDAGGNVQRDTDADGYGNACDADLDADGIVNSRDLGILKSLFFQPDADADLDGDGVVNSRDLARLKGQLFRAPGPSALAP
jgi:hypothetical protein